MIRTASVLTTAALMLAVATPVVGQDVHGSIYHDYRIVTVADGLEHPWSMAWLPGGDLLVTERHAPPRSGAGGARGLRQRAGWTV